MGCQMIDDYHSYPSFWPMKIRDKHTNACARSGNLSSLFVHQKFARLQMMLVKQPKVFTSDLCRPGGNRFFYSEMWKVTALSWLKGHCLTPKAGLQEFRFQMEFHTGKAPRRCGCQVSYQLSQVVIRIGKPSTSNSLDSLLSLKSLHVKRSF